MLLSQAGRGPRGEQRWELALPVDGVRRIRGAGRRVVTGRTAAFSRKQRWVQRALFWALLLFCPVPVTDFLVSAGVVPMGFILFTGLVWGPGLLLLNWLIVPYLLVFHYVSRWLARAGGTRAVTWLVPGCFAALSLFLVYVPKSHGSLAGAFDTQEIAGARS